MRLKRTYQTKLTIDDINRNIRRNMSPEPGFSGNDFTYLSELNTALDTSKSLWYSIPYENKVNIRSHSIFYWPRTEIIFSPTNLGTIVTVNFIGTVLAYIIYGIFVMIFIGLMGSLIINNPSDLSPILAILIFAIPIAIIPFLLRKTQSNIINQLEYS